MYIALLFVSFPHLCLFIQKTLGARRRRSKLDSIGAFRISPTIKVPEAPTIVFDASDLVEEDTAPPERVKDVAVKPEEVCEWKIGT